MSLIFSTVAILMKCAFVKYLNPVCLKDYIIISFCCSMSTGSTGLISSFVFVSLTTSPHRPSSKIEARVYVDLRQIGASSVTDTSNDTTKIYISSFWHGRQ